MSPEAICRDRGLKEGSLEWQQCVQEATAQNERTTQEFYANIKEPVQAQTINTEPVHPEPVVPQREGAYANDNSFLVPPFMQKAFAEKIRQQRGGQRELFTPLPQ
jgi:hypothetical protein